MVSIPGPLPDIKGKNVMDLLWLLLENYYLCENVAVFDLDVKVQLEVHLKAEIYQSLQHLGILHSQSMHSCSHVD